jgi:hypothetical protein
VDLRAREREALAFAKTLMMLLALSCDEDVTIRGTALLSKLLPRGSGNNTYVLQPRNTA